MKIRQLFEKPEARLETRTVDDPDQGSLAQGADADAADEPAFQQGLEKGKNDSNEIMDTGVDGPTVDPELWSTVANDTYVTDFEHVSTGTIHPRKIAAMDKRELVKLQNNISDMISRREMDKGKVGLYNDITYQYLVALSSFTQKVIIHKTSD